MPGSSPLPDLDTLLECSTQFLGDLELASLNRSQLCFKRAKVELEEALAQRDTAAVARWLIENRPLILDIARKMQEMPSPKDVLEFLDRRSA